MTTNLYKITLTLLFILAFANVPYSQGLDYQKSMKDFHLFKSTGAVDAWPVTLPRG